MTERIAQFLTETNIDTPFLVLDLNAVAERYHAFTQLFPRAQIYYAVKANPEPQVLRRLAELGSYFDVASVGEIDLVLNQGIDPSRISFGNTIKKERDIAYGYGRGVRLFAFDSQAELDKLVRAAPGARLICRILFDGQGAAWPLNKKFGCDGAMAVDLMIDAARRGMKPCGLSLHVGSQQSDPGEYVRALQELARHSQTLQRHNIVLDAINIGGGMPAHFYRDNVPELAQFAAAIMQSFTDSFGGASALARQSPPFDHVNLMLEPGRGLVGDAGAIATEIVLVAKKSPHDERSWVYLDIGKFGGLVETMDESIHYLISHGHDYADVQKQKIAAKNGGGDHGADASTNAMMRVILAGPTCDSADVLYSKEDYRLPATIKTGDRVTIWSTGAYTSSYCSVNFNGFPPLKTVCI
ncbi:MAG: type III PLP-dependent enzyme [Candidatus Symbiobacter sp.]|nr:type III PLP-dependent enzyme [Candidatus Symbiobacter sp.]